MDGGERVSPPLLCPPLLLLPSSHQIFGRISQVEQYSPLHEVRSGSWRTKYRICEPGLMNDNEPMSPHWFYGADVDLDTRRA